MSHDSTPSPITAQAGTALRGRLRPPGDKSISHRAIILGLLSLGETRIEGLLEGDDVLRTAAAARRSAPASTGTGRGAGGCAASGSAACPTRPAFSISAMPAPARG